MTSTRCLLEDIHDLAYGYFGNLVLPEAQNSPAKFSHSFVGIEISLSIRDALLHPVLGILLWGNIVRRARMPVATVDENNHFRFGEGNVCPTTPVNWKGPVDSVAQSLVMKQSSNGQFGRRIVPLVRLHNSATSY